METSVQTLAAHVGILVQRLGVYCSSYSCLVGRRNPRVSCFVGRVLINLRSAIPLIVSQPTRCAHPISGSQRTHYLVTTGGKNMFPARVNSKNSTNLKSDPGSRRIWTP